MHYPNTAENLKAEFAELHAKLGHETEWALLTYGLASADLNFAASVLSAGKLRACVHYCPQVDNGNGLVPTFADGDTVP